MYKSHCMFRRALSSLFLVALLLSSSAGQSNDKLTIVGVPEKTRSRLIERINQFVEYDRTRQYEKQYDLYLPEFARLVFTAKNREEYGRNFCEAGESRERMIEFKPSTLVMMENPVYGKVCLIYGYATYSKSGETYEAHVRTKAILRNKVWYFVDWWSLMPE